MSDPIGAASRLGAGAARPLGVDGPKTFTFEILRPEGAPSAGAGSFGDTISGFVNQVSSLENAAGSLRDRYLAGEQVEIHQVTAAAEEAGIALDLMVELRNKVLEAYRTLVNLQ
ncbi:MAG: flagellar hook-basal body complex protein FliE [Gemmatimonadaceae bacterium]|nr:flagellar hook-basal body complex protein FliE [Gemmatimonadaceae bacterium]